MEQQTVYRKKSLERIQSPEQLNDYLRVTNPSVWVILAAVALILAGALIWGSFAYIDSFVTGTAEVKDGVMTVTFEDEALAKNVKAGMNVTVGDTVSAIASVGRASDGSLFAQAQTALADGSYQVKVSYRQTQVLDLLFN
ncbi:MAG: hypothetical protein IK132_01630 [Clostridia bacterium]|nr:hypothetical protein [Clostridia bacterium]